MRSIEGWVRYESSERHSATRAYTRYYSSNTDIQFARSSCVASLLIPYAHTHTQECVVGEQTEKTNEGRRKIVFRDTLETTSDYPVHTQHFSGRCCSRQQPTLDKRPRVWILQTDTVAPTSTITLASEVTIEPSKYPNGHSHLHPTTCASSRTSRSQNVSFACIHHLQHIRYQRIEWKRERVLEAETHWQRETRCWVLSTSTNSLLHHSQTDILRNYALHIA